MNKALIGIVVAVLIAGGAYYFMTMNSSVADDVKVDTDKMMEDTDKSGEAMMIESTESAEAMMEKVDVEVELEGGMFYFEPNIIEAKVGDVVKVTLDNVEGFHDFVVDEFDAATAQIKEGETDTVTFTVTEAGEFEFYCSVGNHREQGMVGTLVVTE